jgi:hypothetical protein
LEGSFELDDVFGLPWRDEGKLEELTGTSIPHFKEKASPTKSLAVRELHVYVGLP